SGRQNLAVSGPNRRFPQPWRVEEPLRAKCCLRANKTLGPCDIRDLSRLNPTPNAIVVYASQPLSPTATQHSLPRALPLTWAGLAPARSHQLCGWRTYSITSPARTKSVGGTASRRHCILGEQLRFRVRSGLQTLQL